MAEAAYENPLIPNARLRQIYTAMLQARMIEKALPASRRARSLGPTPHATNLIGLEACLVATSIDVGPSDLLSDALTGGTIDALRGTPLASVLNPKSRTRSKFTASAGSALHLPPIPAIAERLWAAIGAAATLKAIAAAAKPEANSDAEPDAESGTPLASQPGVVIAYLRPGEAPPGLLRKSLTFAAEKDLPLIFAVMPARGTALTAKSPSISALALTCGVPGIAVDASDAVAIYRVAQESIGRARAGGGPALIECVPFVLEGGGAKQAGPEDAIAVMEQYLLRRKVATEAWINGQRRRFAKRLISK